jgi:topoisomerase IA-like protein
MSEEKGKPQRRLTIAELRKLKNYEDISDEQAQEVIFAVRNLAVIFYEHLNKKKKEQEDTRKQEEQKQEEQKPDKEKQRNSNKKQKNKAA